MIAKIIVTADDRAFSDSSHDRYKWLKCTVAGIETNLEYLQNIIDCDVFKAGTQTTRFLEYI